MFRQFLSEWREWNFRTAFGNLLWQIAYDFNDAKSMRVTYPNKKTQNGSTWRIRKGVL